MSTTTTTLVLAVDLDAYDDKALRDLCRLTHAIASGPLAGTPTAALALDVAAELDQAVTLRRHALDALDDDFLDGDPAPNPTEAERPQDGQKESKQ